MENLKTQLAEEQDILFRSAGTDDNVFVGFLGTMANFHKYDLKSQANLYYHAPAHARALATRDFWQKFGTSLVENADRIPVMKDGTISYVYDLRDTVGFMTGDERLHRIPWRYRAEDEPYLRDAMGASPEENLDDAIRTYVQTQVVASGTDYPNHVSASVEFIVRKRLGLPANENIVRSMSREHIDMEHLLEDIHQISESILTPLGERILQSERELEEERTNGRTRTRKIPLGNVGEYSEEVSQEGTSRGMESDALGGDSENVPGEVSGDDGSAGGKAGEEDRPADGLDGRTQEERHDGVDSEIQQRAGDSTRADDEGNRSLKFPILGGLPAEEAEAAFRAYLDHIDAAKEDGSIDTTEARHHYRDALALIVSGEGDIPEDRRDALTILATGKISDTYEQTPSFGMSSPIRDWYKSEHPEDEAANDLRDVTFEEVLAAMDRQEDFYDFTGCTESDIRESIFNKMSELSGRSYEEIYDLWLGDSHAQTVAQDEAAKQEEKTYKYYLHRPASFGTQLNGFLQLADDEEIASEQAKLPGEETIRGIVYYDHPLTEQEISDYELLDAMTIASRSDSVRAYAAALGEDCPWIVGANGQDVTFYELYQALQRGVDYPAFLHFADQQIPAETFGSVIEHDFELFGDEFARRMNVNSNEIHKLMAQNYMREVASATKFFREQGKAIEEQAENKENADAHELADSPVISKLSGEFRDIFSSGFPVWTISNALEYGISNRELLALGILHQTDETMRQHVEDFLQDINFHPENELLLQGNYEEFFAKVRSYGATPLTDTEEHDRLEDVLKSLQEQLQTNFEWLEHPPFDLTPYVRVQQEMLETLENDRTLSYTADRAIALGLLYIEHPELQGQVQYFLATRWHRSDAVELLQDGEYGQFFADFGVQEQANQEQANEPEETHEVEETPPAQEEAESNTDTHSEDALAAESETQTVAQSEEENAAESETQTSAQAEEETTEGPSIAPSRSTDSSGATEPEDASVLAAPAIDLETLDMDATMATVRGKRAVFRRNIAAIQIVHQIEHDHREPTEKEMAVLQAYSGFGGLSEAFDSRNNAWREEHQMMQTYLTASEQASARESTLSAFYTPKEMIQSIYSGLLASGFTGDNNILDPSTGNGRFLYNLPEEMREGSNLVGIELDELSAKVARAINRHANILHAPFEETHFKDNTFDLAISNVPFGNFPVNDHRYVGHNFLIHDYFINRMLDQVRSGGIVVAITSAGTMDKKDDTARKEFARKADLIKAIRLPSGIFSDAGTEAAADILIFRKRSRERTQEEELPKWVHSATKELFDYYDSKSIEYQINDYFLEHPDDVFGLYQPTTSAFGRTAGFFPSEDINTLKASLRERISHSIQEAGEFYVPSGERPILPEEEKILQKDKEFGFFRQDGKLLHMDVDGRVEEADLPASAVDKVNSIINIRDTFRKMLDEELHNCTDERLAVLQAELNRLYDEHVEKFGYFNGDRTLNRVFKEDSAYPVLLALEIVDNDKVVGKADAFTKRVVHAYVPPDHADTSSEALLISMQEKGKVDLPYMAKLTGSTPEALIKEMEFREIYEDIENRRYVTADEYLSGDVRKRMRTLEGYIKKWQQELDYLAFEELISSLSEIPSANEIRENFPIPRLRNREFPVNFSELYEDEKLALFQPENHPALFYALRHSSFAMQSIAFLRDMAATYPQVDALFQDPSFAIQAYRYTSSPDYFHSFRKYPIFSMTEEALDQLETNFPDDSKDLIYAYLMQCCTEYAHGKHPEAFEAEHLKHGFTDFLQKFEEQKAEYLAHSTDEFIVSLQEDIARAKKNLDALEKVKPRDLSAHEINIFLGASWIPTEDIKQFAADTFRQTMSSLTVEHSDISGAWDVKSSYRICSQELLSIYGIPERDALELLKAALNHSSVVIRKTVQIHGEQKEIVDQEKTLLAARKIQDIRKAFQDWIFKDEERKNRLVDYYNQHFNNIVPRHFDGSMLQFPGMNPEIELRPHQKDAVAHTLFGGNTLLAHAVGAGKTFEMQASAMESKRIGLCKKSMMIMPKHLIQQFGAEFQRLYPNAKILLAGPEDFTKENRRKFCARIMAENWDAVVLSYQQFEKIPLSYERRKKFLQDEADRIMTAKEQGKQSSFSVKQGAREYKKIMASLSKLEEDYHKHQDSAVTFEQLGIDRLYVDEAHFFKNLGFYSRIPGIQAGHTQKTDDMIAKCDYLNELTHEHGVIFATGTPVSNSMAELYTMSRYLKPSRLDSQGFNNFDAWASTFGEEVTQMELEPAGNKFRQKTWFSHFANVPELLSMFKEFSDVKLGDQLKLPVPDSDVKIVTAEASPAQKAMINDLVDRSELIKANNPRVINPEKTQGGSSKQGLDNMLNITNEGRAVALDPRILDPEMPDSPKSKVNLCAQNIADIYHDTADKKSTQLVFCDLSTPKKGKFSVYDDLKEKLIEKGVNKKDIAFIHSYNTPEKKEALFEKVRAGEVRILIGSSDKLGVGTNVQDKIVAMHELDCPWKPAQIEQRRGRAIRVGNENAHVDIYRYVTKGTFDAYMWQVNEYKQKFISQVMTSKEPSRVCDDVDDFQLEASKAKAACTENPIFQEQMTLQNEVSLLKIERAQYLDSKEKLAYRIHTELPQHIHAYEEKEQVLAEDIERYQKGKGQPPKIGEQVFDDDEKLGKYLAKVVSAFYKGEIKSSPRGTYHGLKFTITFNPNQELHPSLRFYGRGSHPPIPLTTSPQTDIDRFHGFGTNLQASLLTTTKEKESAQQALKIAKEDYEVPFSKQELLETKEKRLAEVNALVLNYEGDTLKKEKENRMAMIEDPAQVEGDPCVAAYLKLAKSALNLNQGTWKEETDADIAKSLTHKGFDSAQISSAIYMYSPGIPSKDQAENLLAPKEKAVCACR